MDQLQAIRAFARVVEAGNFSRAADSLQMPNATLTKLVQALESHLGVRLLQRTTRSVTVTAEGAAYYERTARLLKELDDIDASFGSAQRKPRGPLRIDMGASVASMIVIPALPEFLAAYPDIRISLAVSDRHTNLIGENVDCVIRGGAVTDETLVARQVGSAPWVTCAAPAYWRAHGTPQHPHDLCDGHTLVGYLGGTGQRALPLRFAQGVDKLEVMPPQLFGVNESNAHAAAGLAGLGIMQTFRYTARPYLLSGALVEVLPEWRPAPYPFYVVYPPNRHMSQRLRVFIDWITARFAAAM